MRQSTDMMLQVIQSIENDMKYVFNLETNYRAYVLV